MRYPRKKYNPLPKLGASKDEIRMAIQEICKRAGVEAHQSILGPEDDPDGLLTPYNLVWYSVEATGGISPEARPRIKRQTLDLLIDDQEPFYRGVVDELEQETSDKYEEGKIPSSWLIEQEKRGRKTNALRDKYTLWASDYPQQKPATYDEFRDRLNYGSKKRKRLRRR